MTIAMIINAFISISIVLLGSLLLRKKTKAETEGIVVEQFNKLVSSQTKKIELQEEEINENRERIKELKKTYEECELKHEVTELELMHLKKVVDLNSLPKSTVFILDDNPLVIMEFKKIVRDISVLDCKSFTSPEIFLTDAKIERPGIVVVDYMLSDTLTAEEVVANLGYEPEIFIMSGTKSREIYLRVKQKGYKFFYKDDFYVRKIAKAVIRHLHDKI